MKTKHIPTIAKCQCCENDSIRNVEYELKLTELNKRVRDDYNIKEKQAYTTQKEGRTLFFSAEGENKYMFDMTEREREFYKIK